ncbi:MAG: CPBP family intramembrane metalloprotease [Gemmatimonadetes bacterium]|nr:CPBP family intramembrane metalloprotease [Gemmatimonadota bacterium]
MAASRPSGTVAPPPSRPPARTVARYWDDARAPRYSLSLALPLLVGYEVLAALTAGSGDGALRNGADVMLKSAFAAIAGPWGTPLFGLVLLGGGAWLFARDVRRRGWPRAGRLAAMGGESAAFALLTGIVVGSLTRGLLHKLGLLGIAGPMGELPVSTQLALSLGAGIYEELLFRVLLTGALLWFARVALGWGRGTASVAAVIVSALVFSAFHYVGPYGEPLQLASFTFRAIAGLWFSALFVLRGFGITAWAHALYDVWVTLAT